MQNGRPPCNNNELARRRSILRRPDAEENEPGLPSNARRPPGNRNAPIAHLRSPLSDFQISVRQFVPGLRFLQGGQDEECERIRKYSFLSRLNCFFLRFCKR